MTHVREDGQQEPRTVDARGDDSGSPVAIHVDSSGNSYIRDAYAHLDFDVSTISDTTITLLVASNTARKKGVIVGNPSSSNSVWWGLDSSFTNDGFPLLRNQTTILIPTTSDIYVYQSSGGNIDLVFLEV